MATLTRGFWIAPLACALVLSACQSPPTAPSPSLTGLPGVGAALAAARDSKAGAAQIETLESAAVAGRDITYEEYSAAATLAQECLVATGLVADAGIRSTEHDGKPLLELWITYLDPDHPDDADTARGGCVNEHLGFIEGAYLLAATATMSP